MPLVSRRRVARPNSALAKPFPAIAKAMGITKRVSPKAMRRSFQDAMREAQIAKRRLSKHLGPSHRTDAAAVLYLFPLFPCRRERFRTSDPYRVNGGTVTRTGLVFKPTVAPRG